LTRAWPSAGLLLTHQIACCRISPLHLQTTMSVPTGLCAKSWQPECERGGRWPHAQIDPSVRVVDASQGSSTRDLLAEFPGVGRIVRASWPAFSSDRSTAVIYVETRCGERCGQGVLVELIRNGSMWHVSQLYTAWAWRSLIASQPSSPSALAVPGTPHIQERNGRRLVAGANHPYVIG
jgi:hypothetical protein